MASTPVFFSQGLRPTQTLFLHVNGDYVRELLQKRKVAKIVRRVDMVRHLALLIVLFVTE